MEILLLIHQIFVVCLIPTLAGRIFTISGKKMSRGASSRDIEEFLSTFRFYPKTIKNKTQGFFRGR